MRSLISVSKHKFLTLPPQHLQLKFPEFLTSCPCTRCRIFHKLLTKPSPCLPRKYPEFLTSPSLHSSQTTSKLPSLHDESTTNSRCHCILGIVILISAFLWP